MDGSFTKTLVLSRVSTCRRPTYLRLTCVLHLALVMSWVMPWVTSDVYAGDRIYRCEVAGKVTYSDKGCDRVGEQVEISTAGLNTFQAEAGVPTPTKTQSAKSNASSAHPRDTSIALEQQRAKQRCQRLADRLESIQVKRRAGHSVEQGERLREQQRQLEQQRRTEKCD